MTRAHHCHCGWSRVRTTAMAVAAWIVLSQLAASAASGQEPPPPDGGQPPPAATAPTDIITRGTTRERVRLLLGIPRTGSEIVCLGRVMNVYQDGTKIIFVHGKAVSAIPNGLAVGSPHEGYVIEQSNR